MASRSHTLYIGVTNSIVRRVRQHKEHAFPGFTSRYNIDRLVWYETYQYVRTAIAREKQLKGWLRERKIRLIEETNPTWQDRSEDWGSRSSRCRQTQILRRAQALLRMTISMGNTVEPSSCHPERSVRVLFPIRRTCGSGERAVEGPLYLRYNSSDRYGDSGPSTPADNCGPPALRMANSKGRLLKV